MREIPQSEREKYAVPAELREGLAEFGLEADPAHLELAEKRLKVLRTLSQRGLVDMVDDKLVFDDERIKQLTYRGHRSERDLPIRVSDVLTALTGLKGYRKSDTDTEEFRAGKMQPREAVSWPESLKDLAADYPVRSRNAIFRPWEMGQQTKWTAPVELKSGETTNQAELALAATLLGDLKARRTKDGTLEVWNEEAQAYQKFNTRLFHQLTHLRPSAKQGKNLYGWNENPLLFIQKFALQLLELDILRKEDFKVQAGSSTAEQNPGRPRPLNPKAPLVPFTNGAGDYARYNLGREKLIGTDYQIEPGKTWAQLLDPETVGIVAETHGKKRIIYIFNLLTPEESSALREQVKQKAAEKGKKADARFIADYSYVSEEEMKKRLREYRITEFLPRRADESAEAYAERIARLSDTGFVLKTFQTFFSEAGLGVHKLPWTEQLILAGAITEEKNRARLTRFAKQYGIDGIRAFLSVDYDPKLAGIILSLGEKNSEIASLIFRKYNEIADAAGKAEEFVRLAVGVKVDNDLILKIRENLLRRAKDWLARYGSLSKTIDVKQVAKDLDNLKAAVWLYGATFRGLRKEGQKVNLEDLAGAEFIVTERLQPADIARMRKIYARNYSHVPEFQKELLDNFDRVTSPEQGYGYQAGENTYYLLKINGEIRAFNRFHTVGEDQKGIARKEFGFFNVDHDYHGFQIGEAMMERSLDIEARSAILEATCTATDEIAQRYISRGFMSRGFVANYKGIPDLRIERDDRKNREFKTKFIPQSEIKSLQSEENIKVISADSAEKIPFDLTNRGWVLTQYFREGKRYWAVFEKPKAASGVATDPLAA